MKRRIFHSTSKDLTNRQETDVDSKVNPNSIWNRKISKVRADSNQSECVFECNVKKFPNDVSNINEVNNCSAEVLIDDLFANSV
jgi:hypothetical protein